tara:strand:+ start:3369 stop:3704 length:336 start_codon:yes stop_codon:yes gene_type:complete
LAVIPLVAGAVYSSSFSEASEEGRLLGGHLSAQILASLELGQQALKGQNLHLELDVQYRQWPVFCQMGDFAHFRRLYHLAVADTKALHDQFWYGLVLLYLVVEVWVFLMPT